MWQTFLYWSRIPVMTLYSVNMICCTRTNSTTRRPDFVVNGNRPSWLCENSLFAWTKITLPVLPSLPPSLHMAADIWRKAISCERKGACPLLVICRWSWHKWWKSLYKYMRLETLRRGTTLKIHETPVLQSQMFSLPIHPAWILSDCRMAFILEFAHFVPWRVCTHACYSCHSRQLLGRIDCCQAAWSLGRLRHRASRPIKPLLYLSEPLIFRPQGALQVSRWL